MNSSLFSCSHFKCNHFFSLLGGMSRSRLFLWSVRIDHLLLDFNTWFFWRTVLDIVPGCFTTRGYAHHQLMLFCIFFLLLLHSFSSSFSFSFFLILFPFFLSFFPSFLSFLLLLSFLYFFFFLSSSFHSFFLPLFLLFFFQNSSDMLSLSSSVCFLSQSVFPAIRFSWLSSLNVQLHEFHEIQKFLIRWINLICAAAEQANLIPPHRSL